jgi:pyruvate,water dikinase
MTHAEEMANPRLLSEWFERARSARLEELRAEDSSKRDRLQLLQRTLGLPCNETVVVTLEEAMAKGEAMKALIERFGDRECGVRLNPIRPGIPQFRRRGFTLAEALQWCQSLNLRGDDYRLEISPHVSYAKWSSIFVVTNSGLAGELVQGGHELLTQGWSQQGDLVQVRFDGTEWASGGAGADLCAGALQHMAKATRYLRVRGKELQKHLQEVLGTVFWRDFLCGYFETLESDAWGLRFIDYNRVLADYFPAMPEMPTRTSSRDDVVDLAGTPASPGIASGAVRILDGDDLEEPDISGGVLVCRFTTPDHLSLIESAAAVVTELGGMLSHAAILCRELGKPCVTGVENARTLLRGDRVVTVDGGRGTVSFRSAR